VKWLDALTFGRFLGMTELLEKGLVTPEHFGQRCIEIAKEYREAKAKEEAQ
jgi:hypothetical protein